MEYDNFLATIKLAESRNTVNIKKAVKKFENAEKQHITDLKEMSEQSDSVMNAYLAENSLKSIKQLRHGINEAAFCGYKKGAELTALYMEWAIEEAVHSLRFAYLSMLKTAILVKTAAE
jgi:predicted  nucleic acid-binding Zn-ribbon protein